jgi:hypothetical protein
VQEEILRAAIDKPAFFIEYKYTTADDRTLYLLFRSIINIPTKCLHDNMAPVLILRFELYQQLRG